MRINREKMAVAMLRRDMTQKRLAELSGVSRITITAVKGGKLCSANTAEKLAAVLGRDIIREEV